MLPQVLNTSPVMQNTKSGMPVKTEYVKVERDEFDLPITPDRDPIFGSQTIRPDSHTPYSDATQCKKQTAHVKRPMNAFMVSELARTRLKSYWARQWGGTLLL